MDNESKRLQVKAMRQGIGVPLISKMADMECISYTESAISRMEAGKRKVSDRYWSEINDVCIRRNGLLSALKADLYGSDSIKLPYCESLEVYERVASKSVEQWLLWQSVIAELLSKGAPITLDEGAKIPSSFVATQYWLRG